MANRRQSLSIVERAIRSYQQASATIQVLFPNAPRLRRTTHQIRQYLEGVTRYSRTGCFAEAVGPLGTLDFGLPLQLTFGNRTVRVTANAVFTVFVSRRIRSRTYEFYWSADLVLTDAFKPHHGSTQTETPGLLVCPTGDLTGTLEQYYTRRPFLVLGHDGVPWHNQQERLRDDRRDTGPIPVQYAVDGPRSTGDSQRQLETLQIAVAELQATLKATRRASFQRQRKMDRLEAHHATLQARLADAQRTAHEHMEALAQSQRAHRAVNRQTARGRDRRRSARQRAERPVERTIELSPIGSPTR